MQFNIENYPFNTVMHCESREECNIFEEFLSKQGRTWGSGDSYNAGIHDIFSHTEENTCYNYNRGTYCGLNHYEREGYKILRFSDFDWGQDSDNDVNDIILTDFDEKQFKKYIETVSFIESL